MGLKARTRRSASIALPKSVQLASAGPVRWADVEELVYAESWRALSEFAKTHTDERFAAFVIDCDSEHGDAQLALDTEDDARSRQRQQGNDDVPAERLKWAPTSFAYSDFFELNNCQGWDAVVTAVEEGAAKSFVETLCRALVRLQNDGCFDELFMAPDFDVLVLDHREEAWAAHKRLQAFRSAER